MPAAPLTADLLLTLALSRLLSSQRAHPGTMIVLNGEPKSEVIVAVGYSKVE
jgi:hypothetical protein